MNKLQADLWLIETASKAVVRNPDSPLARHIPAFHAIRDQLSPYLSEESDDPPASLARVLSDFITEHGIWSLVSGAVAENALHFIADARDFYQGIQTTRPLNEDEKEVGEYLMALLQEVRQLTGNAESIQGDTVV